MRLPSISQYVESLDSPFGLFRTLKGCEAERDAFGEVRLRSGNNAAVFRIARDARYLALKCYIKPGRFTRQIYSYLSDNPSPLVASGCRLLPGELYVYDHCEEGQYHDVAVWDWVEGETLDTEIRRAALSGNRGRLETLAGRFDALSAELLHQEWAHGDLKPDNIVVDRDGRMTLIDLDAMFIPALEGEQTPEVGTLNYQHPLRNEEMFSKRIDDYSIALISTSLHVLALDPSLYKRFNNTDNIFLNPGEILTGTSEAYVEAMRLATASGHHALVGMAGTLLSPTPCIDRLPVLVDNLLPATSRKSPVSDVSARLFNQDGKWGYTDPDGDILIEAVYEDAGVFSEGMAAVCIRGRRIFIDLSGCEAIDCSGYDRIQTFREGLAAVCRHDRWGYINRQGTEVIPVRYEIASPMRENLAPVKYDGLYGYIDRSGAWQITPRFTYATSFREGVAEVSDGEKTYRIDKTGHPV